MDIFISVGRRATDDQVAFLRALMGVLVSHGAKPHVIGLTDSLFKEPLKQIKDVMSVCVGLVVVAHERLSAPQAEEFAGTPAARPLTNVVWSTPWNHAETAMAYALSLPVFVICQRGIRQDGMLDRGLPWAVYEVEIAGDAFEKADLQKGLAAWLREIEKTPRPLPPNPAPPKIDPDKLTLAEIFKSLTASHFKAGVIAFIAAVSAIASAGYYVGSQSAKFSSPPSTQSKN